MTTWQQRAATCVVGDGIDAGTSYRCDTVGQLVAVTV